MIAEHVLRIPLQTPTLPPATRTNTYVVGSIQLCVVDPAPVDASGQEALCQQVLGMGATTVHLVLTHHHGDHVGAVEALRGPLNAQVWAHPETGQRVPFAVDRLLQDGDALPADGGPWVSVHTPGHAAGHLCFHRVQDGAVLAGDMVAGVGTILVDPSEGSMRAYMASLQRLVDLKPQVLMPAHGFELTPAVDALNHYLHHRTLRLHAVAERLRHGDETPEQMVPHIYAGTPPSFFPLAARSVLSMLIMLEEDGGAACRTGRWTVA